ncbi:hypothetical protein DY000_02034018 [Brassica cretica]|uniref:Replication protein A 70 kDa DNA-binding subunit B/D first OB fold domain-containing protein n=1 Tax=Brassica cretica TaxID=69181 RepID=A0ABQ7DGQ8_BRACR|nr:hypothetical protein DY000_02034018 [Brassica cretica]
MDVMEAIQMRREHAIICVIRFGKIKMSAAYPMQYNVSSVELNPPMAEMSAAYPMQYNVSSVELNPPMAEVDSFLALLPKDELALAIVDPKPLSIVSAVSEKDDFLKNTPRKTLSQLSETRQIAKCIVMCTVAAIDSDMGWYYLSCKVCAKKVLHVPNDTIDDEDDENSIMFSYYCPKCKVSNPKLLPRYKLHLIVVIPFPAIRVKIIKKWSTKIGRDHHSVMLLGDANGVTIQGSLNYALSLPREIELKEDDWVEILNFDIRYVFELHRTTKHKYTIKFNESSLFRKIQPVNGSNFLCCANFRGIKRGLYHPMYCIDLCGALVRAGDLIATKLAQPANIYNSILYSLEFSLINLGFCVAYGALAHRLNAFWRANTADVVVTVLRLWRIEWGEGGFNYATNMEGGSDILFDSNIPEIQFFKSQIPSIDF